MRGKLLKNLKWGIGTWAKGTVVSIIQHSESHPDKVKIERFPGGPAAWVYLDDMLDKLKGVTDTSDLDAEAERAKAEAAQAEADAKKAAEEAAGRQAIAEHQGSPTQDSTDYKSEYELANKVADTQIEELNNQIDKVKVKISDSIDEIKRKATLEGRDLTPDEVQRLAELQRDLFQAEVERYTKQKAIIETVLNPADTDQKHTEEIKKKSLDAQGNADKAQGEVDKLNTSLFNMANAAGNLASIINSTGDATTDWAAKVEESGRKWLNRDDGVSRYGDNRINPDLLARWPGYWKYFSSGQRRKTLVVFGKDLSGSILKVAGYTTNESGEYSKIYLDSPLKKPLRKNDILMISYLCRYRHDSDSMTVDYETVEAGTTSFTLAEVTE